MEKDWFRKLFSRNRDGSNHSPVTKIERKSDAVVMPNPERLAGLGNSANRRAQAIEQEREREYTASREADRLSSIKSSEHSLMYQLGLLPERLKYAAKIGLRYVEIDVGGWTYEEQRQGVRFKDSSLFAKLKDFCTRNGYRVDNPEYSSRTIFHGGGEFSGNHTEHKTSVRINF